MTEKLPFNVETDPNWNREPGIVLVPGSNYVREIAKFEQFHGGNTIGTVPGNPYVYRPYPKMMYRAEHYQGKVCCMATPPDSYEFKDEREFQRAQESAERFTLKCQLTVNSEAERSRAMEDGWRESPAEAVEYLLGRDRATGLAAAHREYEDRNMSDSARREIASARESSDTHLAEVPEKRKRGRPRKVTSPKVI